MRKRIINRFIIPVSLFLLIVTITFFWIGWHNIDNSFNVLKISYDTDLDIFYNNCDKTAYGNCISYTSMYVLGMNLMSMCNGMLALLCVVLLVLYIQGEKEK